jgi:hypothetical protein|tara:strand:+ start:1187 stop:1300 length:114 start_codon:yes stop_codon:yes gene_type:complete
LAAVVVDHTQVAAVVQVVIVLLQEPLEVEPLLSRQFQ